MFRGKKKHISKYVTLRSLAAVYVPEESQRPSFSGSSEFTTGDTMSIFDTAEPMELPLAVISVPWSLPTHLSAVTNGY